MPEADAVQRRPKHRQERNGQPQSDSNAKAHAGADLNGMFSLPEGLMGSDFSESTFQRHAALLGDPGMSRPMYTRRRMAMVQKLQRDYGNSYVQRLIHQVQTAKKERIQTTGQETQGDTLAVAQRRTQRQRDAEADNGLNREGATLQTLPAGNVVERDVSSPAKETDESTGGGGFFGRLGQMVKGGLDVVGSALSQAGSAVVQGYETAKEVGATVMGMAKEAGSTAGTAAVDAVKKVGQALVDTGVAAKAAAVDMKDTAIAKAQAAGEKLVEMVKAAGSYMGEAAVAGWTAVEDAAERFETYLEEKGILPVTKMTDEEKQALAQKDLPLELMAHGLAYSFPKLNEPETFEAAGYDPRNIHMREHPDGLRYVWIVPRLDENGQALNDPILAFRGTSNLDNAFSDADPAGIGYFLFEQHREEVLDTMKGLGSFTGKVFLTGHSLGGALAQRAAMIAPGLVKRLVTFQSPGVSIVPLDQLEELSEKVTHHIVTRDVVDLAGGFNVPGEYIVHRLPGYDPVMTHTKNLLDTDHTMWNYKQYPLSYKLKALPSETLRTVLGVLCAPLVYGRQAYHNYLAKGVPPTSFIENEMKNVLSQEVSTEPPEEAAAD